SAVTIQTSARSDTFLAAWALLVGSARSDLRSRTSARCDSWTTAPSEGGLVAAATCACRFCVTQPGVAWCSTVTTRAVDTASVSLGGTPTGAGAPALERPPGAPRGCAGGAGATVARPPSGPCTGAADAEPELTSSA